MARTWICLLYTSVEDNREILDYVAESFIDEFDVLKAGDGREGLALELNKVPDVIISDVMMPNMAVSYTNLPPLSLLASFSSEPSKRQ